MSHIPHDTQETISQSAESIASPTAVETKDIVTPYAFGVSDALLGIPLATPFQRGVAQCIDMCCVVILSSLNTLFLTLIAAATFHKASRNLKNSPHRSTTRTLLRLSRNVLLVWSVMVILSDVSDDQFGINESFNSQFLAQLSNAPDTATGTNSPSTTSIIAWAKGLVADLGLGFGWAALYYSVFTAWFNGKTPGKRLMNIRVLKLNGDGLSLWESFGRYGGYGAGLATGLLGFMQIYWDPNRQAIQDKISETLVIHDKQAN